MWVDHRKDFKIKLKQNIITTTATGFSFLLKL